ncbi:permease [Veronia nyctiphanis]|uniref:Permease n=1 Tax=Veronia nyctiphanis TaxID=1278244 RepID=A0A4V1LT49_9GAMM|nr:FtsX-like permease family protein [Veronia nyctiphanis]RXJ73958.1 permease [Veronia nyctiphanis]
MKGMTLAWLLFNEERKEKHHRYFSWVQGLLMVFIVTLSLASENIQYYLQDNLRNLLGADAVISQPNALTPEHQAYLTELSEKMVVTRQVDTTLLHDGSWQRTKLKAVGEGYPLQGQLKIATALNGEGVAASAGPESGNIWLDERLFNSLSLNIGDEVVLSEQRFVVSQILLHEPDRIREGYSSTMRAMINAKDLERLNFPPELVHYRYLLAGDKTQVSDILSWQKEVLPAAVISHQQGAHPLALFWKRTENFFGLMSIILFFMAAIAIEQLMQLSMKREKYFTAVCMSLGSKRSVGLKISLLKWLFSLIMIIPFVLVISAACHWLIIDWMQSTFSDLQWHWDTSVALSSLAAVTFILMVFQLPVWIAITQSSVARLLNDVKKDKGFWMTKLSAVAVFCLVAWVYSDNGLLTAMMLGALALSVVLMVTSSWAVLTVGEKVSQPFSGLVPFTLFMMKQRLLTKSTQILGVGLCAFLLLFTLMVLRDLGDTITSNQRVNDGNVLISKATESQMADITRWADEQNVEIRQSKPFVFAKLLKVNGETLDEYAEQPSQSLDTMKTSIRLHWSQAVPSNNRIIKGSWWSENSAWDQVSIEPEVMTDLGLQIGDRLTFFVGQQELAFTITASHVYAGAGSITFWVQMPPSALAYIDAPKYSMASMELPKDKWSQLGELWKKHPTLQMVTMKEMTERFDANLAMLTDVVSSFALLISLLAGIVILSSIHALESKEKRKNSIIMSFGFSRKTCLMLNVFEWVITALTAAFGSVAGAYFAGLMVYQSQFSLTYTPDFIWMFATVAVILVLVVGTGVLASRRNLDTSIRHLMAEG